MVRKMSKYQFGGDESTSFFNQLADSYISQYMQEQAQPFPAPEQDNVEHEDTDDDYAQLQQDYNDLQQRYDDLSSQPAPLYTPDSFDDNFLNFLFSSDLNKKGPVTFDEPQDAPEVYGNINFKEGVSSEGLKPKAQQILSGLTDMVGDVTVTSGLRSASQNVNAGGAKKSFHLTGDAVDLRPTPGLDNFLSSEQGRKYIASQGYEIIDERNRKGHGAHWHLEPKYQFGGVAQTSEEQYTGLNDPSFDEMYFPMRGINVFRGLDNGQPVLLIDQTGNQQILHNNNQTAYMSGGVYEKRL